MRSSGRWGFGRSRQTGIKCLAISTAPVAQAVNPIESVQDLKTLLSASVSHQVFIHHEIRDKLLEEG